MKKFLAAAATFMAAAGLVGCAQERMSVEDSCDEIQAVMVAAMASNGEGVISDERADELSRAIDDLSERVAAPLESPLERLSARFAEGDLANQSFTAEDEAAMNQVSDTCPQLNQ